MLDTTPRDSDSNRLGGTQIKCVLMPPQEILNEAKVKKKFL